MITLLIHDQCEVRSAPEGRPAMAAAAPRPFGALLKRYRQAAGLTQEALAGQAGLSIRTISDLVRLLPELAQGPIESLPAWTLPPAQERRLVFAAVARLLGNVAEPGGTLLLLDDLQWADPDALALLASLLHSEAPLRVLGAYRDTEVQPETALAVAVADLAQAGRAAQHSLGPLAALEAAHLLAALCPDAGAAAPAQDGWAEQRALVLQRAGGVPFVLVSYAQALREGAGQAGGTPAVPWDVAQGVRQRVAALPALAQELLAIVAVLGREASRRLLPLVAGAAEEAVVVAALEAAGRARLLE